MSKAVLVIEMPENCLECPCGDGCGDRCQVTDREVGTPEDGFVDGQYDKPDWCPLVPKPERKQNAFSHDFSVGMIDSQPKIGEWIRQPLPQSYKPQERTS